MVTSSCSVVDLQLIEHDGHNPSVADLQLIRAEHLHLPPVPLVAHIGITTRRDLGGTGAFGTICCSSHIDQICFLLLLSRYAVRVDS